MFTLTAFEILLFEGISVLAPAQRGARSERVKETLQRMCFPVKFEKFLSAPILENIYERLLLKKS